MTTRSIRKSDIVADLVIENPGLARVFESFGINYCCGGNRPLEEAANEKGIDADALVIVLNVGLSGPNGRGVPNPASLSTAELVDHIVETHHAYLKKELPRLVQLTRKVADSHGDQDPRLHEVAEVVARLAAELSRHLESEESELFPVISGCGVGAGSGEVCGTARPAVPVVEQLLAEHNETGRMLESLRAATDDFTLPDWGCNTYRAMLAGLEELEQDTREHVHLENDALFPRVVA